MALSTTTRRSNSPSGSTGEPTARAGGRLMWFRRAWVLLTFSALCLAAWVSMSEVDKIISAVQIGSASHSATSLFSPFVTPSDIAAGFQDWSEATAAVQSWLNWYLRIDLLFIAGYTVVLMAYSEFGRRVAANASHGTDHGTAGPVFVAGLPVRGGFYGEEPSLTDLDNGDLKPTTDFRDIYHDLLVHTVGTDPTPSVGAGRTGLGFL